MRVTNTDTGERFRWVDRSARGSALRCRVAGFMRWRRWRLARSRAGAGHRLVRHRRGVRHRRARPGPGRQERRRCGARLQRRDRRAELDADRRAGGDATVGQDADHQLRSAGGRHLRVRRRVHRPSGSARTQAVTIDVAAASSLLTLRASHSVRMGANASVRAWPADGAAVQSISWTQLEGPTVYAEYRRPVCRDLHRTCGRQRHRDPVCALRSPPPAAPPTATRCWSWSSATCRRGQRRGALGRRTGVARLSVSQHQPVCQRPRAVHLRGAQARQQPCARCRACRSWRSKTAARRRRWSR